MTADIAEIESNTLRALDALASKAESAQKVGELAKRSSEVVREVEVWLSVIARCFQLHEEAAVLELDYVREVAAADLDGHRLALQESRDGLRDRITQTTLGLVQRLDKVASEADVQVLLHSRSVRTIAQSSNQVGDSIIAFHRPLGIEAEREAVAPTSWRTALSNRDHLKVAAAEAGKKAMVGAGAAGGLALTVVGVVAASSKDTDRGA